MSVREDHCRGILALGFNENALYNLQFGKILAILEFFDYLDFYATLINLDLPLPWTALYSVTYDKLLLSF